MFYQFYNNKWYVPLIIVKLVTKTLIIMNYLSGLKITAEKNNRKCNGFNGYNGNCIGFNGNYNGVYWYVMDSIGGMLNPIGKMPKTHYKMEFCNGFTGKS